MFRACVVTWIVLMVSTWASASPPNIVLVLADDLGYGDPRCYNADSVIPTPHMDRLAAEGMRFTDAHSPSAVCTPTRYAMLTGRYTWRGRLKNSVLFGYSRSLIEPDRMTLAAMLQARGYHTAVIGKWHLGFQEFDAATPQARVDYSQPLRPGPITVGFDYFYGIPASLDMEPYVWVHNDAVIEAATETIEASKHRREGGEGFWRGGPIAPSFKHIDVHPIITEKSVQYIEQRRQNAPKQPFFLYVPLASPHTPWLPTEKFQGVTGIDPPGGHYTDFVAEVDWTVGRIMQALEEAGLADNTLLIVTSDNGAHWYPADIERHGHRANGPWRGQKADIHEGGHRVPFIVRWPERVPAGAVSDELLCLTDLFATFAALTDFDLPDEAAEDSFNMLPVWLDEPREGSVRPFAVHHSLDGMFALRDGDWKFIEHLGSGGFTRPSRIEAAPDQSAGQLYNLRDDPRETTNLYAEQAQQVQRLQTLLDQLRRAGHTRPRANE